MDSLADRVDTHFSRLEYIIEAQIGAPRHQKQATTPTLKVPVNWLMKHATTFIVPTSATLLKEGATAPTLPVLAILQCQFTLIPINVLLFLSTY